MYTGKFLGNFCALRAQANFESNFEKYVSGPTEAHTQENGSNGSAGSGERLTEEEEREMEERVKSLYEGMAVRGLKRVLLAEVAKHATEVQYYGTQGRAQETEGHTGEGTERADERGMEEERSRQGDTGPHEHTQQGGTESGAHGEEEGRGRVRGEPEASGAARKRTRQSEQVGQDEEMSNGEEGEQGTGPHDGEQQGTRSAKRRRTEEGVREEEGTRGARDDGLGPSFRQVRANFNRTPSWLLLHNS